MRWLPLLALGCFACTANRGQPCSPSATGAPDPVVLVALTGTPLELELVKPPAVYCPDGNPVATGVITSVLGPASEAIEHTATAATSNNVRGYATAITFTPERRGVYALSARFEPSLGVAQRHVQVAQDRGAEAPRALLELGGLCDAVHPLAEAVLCQRGGQVLAFRDGGAVSTEPVLGLEHVGAVAWLWTDAGVTRLRDVDGGFEREALAVPVTPGAAVGVSATRWVQAVGTEFLEVSAADGGLVSSTWRIDPAAGPVTGPALGVGDDVVGWSTPSLLCDAAAGVAPVCVTSPFTPLAAQGDVLWLRGKESGAIGLARFSASGLEPSVFLMPAQNLDLFPARPTVPFASAVGRLVALRPDDLALDAWTQPPNVARQLVTADSVIFQQAGGKTWIYAR